MPAGPIIKPKAGLDSEVLRVLLLTLIIFFFFTVKHSSYVSSNVTQPVIATAPVKDRVVICSGGTEENGDRVLVGARGLGECKRPYPCYHQEIRMAEAGSAKTHCRPR